MQKRIILAAALLVIFVTICLLLMASNNTNKTEKTLNKAIIGTWILVSKELPDGKLIKPPDISGLVINTSKYSSMNAINPLGDGKFNAWVMGTNFDEVSDKTLKFKRILYASVFQGHDEWGKIDPKPENMEWGVELSDGKIILKPGDETELIIDGDTMIHKFKDGTKDTWKRVEKITTE